MLTTYDKTDPKSIEEYAKQLIGHTFEEVLSWNLSDIKNETAKSYDAKQRKGGLGNLIEEQFFGIKANSESRPDIPEAGVEIKTSCFEKKRDGSLRAGERLVLGMIDYNTPIESDFYASHLWSKTEQMLLIYYLRNKKLPSNLQYKIDFVSLFTPPEEDMKIILDDYKKITEKIAAGKADELSEADTMYLGACTKGTNAEKSTVPQAYYNPKVKARKRAFCYKNSYMTYVLNNYLIPAKEKDESLIKDISELKDKTFEEVISERINRYVGKTDKELCSLFGRPYNNNKSQWADLSYRMLGIKSNQAKEFKKAQIVVKAIRLESDGHMVESSPLPTIKFNEVVAQDWEDSELYEYLSETKFLFVVFKKTNDEYVLNGCQLWNMPNQDLGGDVRNGWLSIRKIIKDGIVLTPRAYKNGTVIKNNLPKKNDNRIIHIRPHANLGYTQLADGSVYGSGTIADSDELPDGRRMTKQSFWLNNSYIVSQLDERLKS